MNSLEIERPAALTAEDERTLGHLKNYPRKMMAFLLLTPTPKHIVLLGRPRGPLLRYCYRGLARTRITLVDPATPPDGPALRAHLKLPIEDARVRILNQTAMEYLTATRERPDVIHIDSMDEKGVAPAFATPEIFESAFHLLTREGVLVMNLAGSKLRYVAPIQHLRKIFAAVRILPVAGEENVLLIVCKRPDLLKLPEYLDRRAQVLEQHLGLAFPHYLERLRDSPLLRRGAKR